MGFKIIQYASVHDLCLLNTCFDELIKLFVTLKEGMVLELQVDLQDVAFLASQASLCNTFLKSCGRDEAIGTTHALKLWCE